MSFDLPVTPPERVTGLVAGKPSLGGGTDLPVFYPGTGAQISTLTEDDAAAVDAAVLSARAAFDRGPWPKLSVAKRIEVLEACRQVILDNVDELARLECAATGLVLKELRARHMVRAAGNFRFFAHFMAARALKSGEAIWTMLGSNRSRSPRTAWFRPSGIRYSPRVGIATLGRLTSGPCGVKAGSSMVGE